MHALPKDLTLKIISFGGRDLRVKLHIMPGRFSRVFIQTMQAMLDPVIADHPVCVAYGWYNRPSLKYTTTYDYWRGHLKGLYYEFIRRKISEGIYAYHVFTPHGYIEVPGTRVLAYALRDMAPPPSPLQTPPSPGPSRS
jgi:hypothetical protein